MATPIEQAREDVYKALTQLPSFGLRADYSLKFKRANVESSQELSMMLADVPQGDQPIDLEYLAPEIMPASGFAPRNIVLVAGGIIQAGDIKARVIRTIAVESFLSSRIANPSGTGGEPYPEIPLILFEINGEDYRVVAYNPMPIYTDFYVRKLAR